MHLGPLATSLLLSIFNQIWSTTIIPGQWKLEIIIPILKPGKDASQPDSYRPISLLPSISKLFERLVYERLRPLLLTTPMQAG